MNSKFVPASGCRPSPPRDVAGEEVGRRLDPLERAPHRPGHRPAEHRLADAGDVLDQEVAAGEEGRRGHSVFARFPPDDLLDVLDKGTGGRGRSGSIHQKIVAPSQGLVVLTCENLRAA